MEEKKKRGGARPGAGRPRTDNKNHFVWCNDEELIYLKQCLAQYRAAKKEQKE